MKFYHKSRLNQLWCSMAISKEMASIRKSKNHCENNKERTWIQGENMVYLWVGIFPVLSLPWLSMGELGGESVRQEEGWTGCHWKLVSGQMEGVPGGRRARSGMWGIFAESKPHFPGSAIWSAWICATTWGGSDLSRLIGAAAALPCERGNVPPCPVVAQQHSQCCTGHSTGKLACLLQCK